MNLLHLKYFKTIAQLGNISQASKQLHIAQPALSRTIAHLEEELGCPLFTRQGRHIQLNEYGKHFLKHVIVALDELEQGSKEIRDMCNNLEKQVHVGAFLCQVMSTIFSIYIKKYPEIKLYPKHIMDWQESYQLLLTQQVDFTISSIVLPDEYKILEQIPLIDEPIYLAVSPYHPFAKSQKVSLKEVVKEPIISLAKNSDINQILQEAFAKAGLELIISLESRTIDLAETLIEKNLGVAFFPMGWWQRPNSLVKVSIEDFTLQRTLWLAYNRQYYMTKSACTFKDFIIDFFKKQKKKIDE